MNNFKKLTFALVSAALLAGCSQGGASSATSESKADAGSATISSADSNNSQESEESISTSGKTEIITVWVHKSSEEPEGKVYKQLATNFNKAGIKNSAGSTLRVNMEFYGSTLDTKVTGALLTNGLPDVLAVDSPDITANVYNNILVDFSSQVSEEEKNDYVTSVLEQSTIDGKLYALSGMEAPGGLYYNKKALESVGYTESDFGTLENPWSWKDVKNAMVKLKNAKKAYKIKLNLGFGTDGYMYLYSPLVYSAGATFGSDGSVEAALTSDKAVAGIQQFEMFFDKEGLSDGESWSYSGSNEYAFLQEADDVAFEIYGPWHLSSLKQGNYTIADHYGIMPMPVYEDASGNKSKIVSTPCGSYGFGVTRDNKSLENSAAVVKYLTGKDASEMMYNAIGTFPTHKSSLSTLTDLQTGAAKSLNDYLNANTITRPKMTKYPMLKAAYQEVLSYIKNKNSLGSSYNLKNKISQEMRAVDKSRA